VRSATPDEVVRIRKLLDSLRLIHAPRLDSIANGADDDGSGTAGILEIAEALASARVKPKRSILFVSHTAEESGLLGSAWYTDHPTVPIDSIVAEIDVDMIGRGAASDLPGGGPTYLEVVGARRLSNEFGDMLEAANAHEPLPFVFNYSYDVPNHPLQYYCRADHYSYARYGIPSVSFSRGEHLDYHQVTDEPQYIDYVDFARLTKLVYDAALRVANADHRPKLDSPKQADPHAPCRQ
jgi:Zn-dependent M28 family amino/carboxypeptidase